MHLYFHFIAKVNPGVLTKFGEKVSLLCSNGTDEQRRKLMETLGLPLQSCSSPNFMLNVIGALYTRASEKEFSSFALHQMLQSLSPDYGTNFRQSFAWIFLSELSITWYLALMCSISYVMLAPIIYLLYFQYTLIFVPSCNWYHYFSLWVWLI